MLGGLDGSILAGRSSVDLRLAWERLVSLCDALGKRGEGTAEVFHWRACFERIRPAHEAFGMPKGELEDHKVYPKSFVLGWDSLETSEASERLRFFLEWLVLS